jgi:hypothetical protein
MYLLHKLLMVQANPKERTPNEVKEEADLVIDGGVIRSKRMREL